MCSFEGMFNKITRSEYMAVIQNAEAIYIEALQVIGLVTASMQYRR